MFNSLWKDFSAVSDMEHNFYCGQDVGDVLTALDYVISKGIASSSKVAVVGGSHGGFLTTHLVGQVR